MFISTYALGGDVAPPPAPAGLGAVPGEGIVTLDWEDNPVADLMGYVVFRSLVSGGPCAPLSGLLTTSNYADANVTNGATYYYFVVALDLVGNTSKPSEEASATPQAPGGPAVTPLRRGVPQ
jgi:predicted phage tail protein